MEISQATTLANELMNNHNLTHWKLEWIVSRRMLGRCIHYRKVIQLSYTLVKIVSDDKVKDTILHEIAHALTPGEGHNKKWRAKALEIGCDGKRCYSLTDEIKAIMNYEYQCIKCGYIFSRFRRIKNLENTFHKLCSGNIRLIKKEEHDKNTC